MAFNSSPDTISALERLAKELVGGKRALFVTGAGYLLTTPISNTNSSFSLSVASGISTYRSSSKHAIWNKFVTSWGTRKKFLDNPVEWSVRYTSSTAFNSTNSNHFSNINILFDWTYSRWNKFWLRTHETPEFLSAKPNAGHLAISHIGTLLKKNYFDGTDQI